jgi:hypothetical protein
MSAASFPWPAISGHGFDPLSRRPRAPDRDPGASGAWTRIHRRRSDPSGARLTASVVRPRMCDACPRTCGARPHTCGHVSDPSDHHPPTSESRPRTSDERFARSGHRFDLSRSRPRTSGRVPATSARCSAASRHDFETPDPESRIVLHREFRGRRPTAHAPLDNSPRPCLPAPSSTVSDVRIARKGDCVCPMS